METDTSGEAGYVKEECDRCEKIIYVYRTIYDKACNPDICADCKDYYDRKYSLKADNDLGEKS